MSLQQHIRSLNEGEIIPFGGVTYKVVRVASNGNVTLRPLNGGK